MEGVDNEQAKIIADFLVEYTMLSVPDRCAYGFPKEFTGEYLQGLTKKERAHFVVRASNWLTSLKEARERAKAAGPWKEKCVKQKEMEKTQSYTGRLLQRFMARSPEERVYIFRYVFGTEEPPERVTWRFYSCWALVETESGQTKTYAEHVDKFLTSLSMFE